MATKSKPGVMMLKNLSSQEERLKAKLKNVAARKQYARDKATGKTKARGYVVKWLEALTATELREQVALWDGNYDDFEEMKDAVQFVAASMFLEHGTVQPEEEEEEEQQELFSEVAS